MFLGAGIKAEAEEIPLEDKLSSFHFSPTALLLPFAWPQFHHQSTLAPPVDLTEVTGSKGSLP